MSYLVNSIINLSVVAANDTKKPRRLRNPKIEDLLDTIHKVQAGIARANAIDAAAREIQEVQNLVKQANKSLKRDDYDKAIRQATDILLRRSNQWSDSSYAPLLRWALMILANAYFMRALSKDKTEGKGAGREDYLKALAIYTTILSCIDSSYALDSETQKVVDGDPNLKKVLGGVKAHSAGVRAAIKRTDRSKEVISLTGTNEIREQDKIAELHYDLADIYKQTGRYEDARREYEIVFSQLPETHPLYQKAKIGYAEALIYVADDYARSLDPGKIDKAKQLIVEAQSICRKFILEDPDDPTVLGRLLLTLGWSYAIRGSIAEREEKGSGKKYYLAAAAIYGYTLEGAFIDKINNTPQMKQAVSGEGLNDILAEIGMRRDDILDEDTLTELMLGELDLMIYKADAIAGAKEYDWAIQEYDAILSKYPNSVEARLGRAETLKAAKRYPEAIDEYGRTMELIQRTDPKGYVQNPQYLKAKIGLAEAKISYAEKLLKEGKRDEALALLNEAEKDLYLLLIQKPGSLPLVIRAVFALNFAFGLKARIAKSESREAEQAELMKIVALNKTLLYGIASVKSDPELWGKISGDASLLAVLNFIDSNRATLTSTEVLKGVDSSVQDIKLKLAEALKQLQRYKEALVEYNDILKVIPNSIMAKLGKAETELPLAKSLIRENKTNEAKGYVADAIKLLIEIAAANVKDPAVLLRLILSITWAFNLEADIAEIERDPKARHDDICLSAVIMKVLLEGKSSLKSHGWKEILESAMISAKAHGLDLAALLDLIDKNRKELMSPELLSEMGIPAWLMTSSFIGNLVSLERYDEAEEEIMKVLKPLLAKGALSAEERTQVAKLYALLGDIMCWHKRDFGKAKDNYLKAIEFAGKLENADPETAETVIAAHYGLAFIYTKTRKFEKAETEYNFIISYYTEKAKKGPLGPRDTEILIKAYLGLGDLYSYSLKNGAKARAAYEKALSLTDEAPTTNEQRKLRAMALLGLGDVERMIDHNYEKAIEYYDRALELVSGLGGADGAKIRARIEGAKAAALRRDVKGGPDYELAGSLYDLADRELDSVPRGDPEAREIRRKNDRERADTIVERNPHSFSIRAFYDTETSTHNPGAPDETNTNLNTEGVQANFPLGGRIRGEFSVSHGDLSNLKITMPGTNLINSDDLDNPYIPVDGNDTVNEWAYTKEDVTNALNDLSGRDLTLLRGGAINSARLSLYYEKEFNRITLRPYVFGEYNSMTYTTNQWMLTNYPFADSLTSDSTNQTFQSTSLGLSFPVDIANPIPERILPNSLSFEVGGRMLYKSMPYGTFPLDEGRIGSQLQSNSDTIAGYNQWITNLDAIINDPSSLPADIAAAQAKRDWLQNQVNLLEGRNGKLRSELDDLSQNRPLTSYYGQVMWSATIPYERIGIESNFPGYGLTVNLGARYDYDEISPTWNGFWHLEDDPTRMHLLLGLSNKFYLPGGVIMPLSASYAMPLGDGDGQSINADLGFVFTSLGRRGFVPELDFNYSDYSDNANQSQKIGLSLKFYYK